MEQQQVSQETQETQQEPTWQSKMDEKLQKEIEAYVTKDHSLVSLINEGLKDTARSAGNLLKYGSVKTTDWLIDATAKKK